MNITITERGWPGHFICSSRCEFTRNTLISNGELNIIVSTVGAMMDIHISNERRYEMVGLDRYYETMAFHAEYKEPYWDSDVTRQVSFNSPWYLPTIEFNSDALANDMHETVVKEITENISICNYDL